jgi:CRISPR-associated protein Cas1
MARDLHALPRLSDRWSHLYLERGRLQKTKEGLGFVDPQGGITAVPLDQFAVILLGPGTTLTHAAARMLADNNTLVCWSGEQGVRLYAYGTGGTHSAARLLRQAEAWADPRRRLAVIARMYRKRFVEEIPPRTSLETIRAMEGYRVRACYEREAARLGVEWKGRNYDQSSWDRADPLNRALSAANSCLYGICHAAILSAGYSPSIGFVHTGKQLSFVYDIADLYKTDLTIPCAFETVAEGTDDVERRVRIRSRDLFHEQRLLGRIVPDISEVLDVTDDTGEIAGELEGLAVSLADRGAVGGLPGESQLPDTGCSVGQDGPASAKPRVRNPDLE